MTSSLHSNVTWSPRRPQRQTLTALDGVGEARRGLFQQNLFLSWPPLPSCAKHAPINRMPGVTLGNHGTHSQPGGLCSLWNRSPKSSSPPGSSPSRSGVAMALCHLFGGRSLHYLLHTFSSKNPATETCPSDRDTLGFAPVDPGLRSQLISRNENSHWQCRPETRWTRGHPSTCWSSSEPCLTAAVWCSWPGLSCLLQ